MAIRLPVLQATREEKANYIELAVWLFNIQTYWHVYAGAVQMTMTIVHHLGFVSSLVN
jgi:hypothetical protein